MTSLPTGIDRCRRTVALERQAQRERHELERTKAVAGPTVQIPTSKRSNDDAE